MTCTSCNAPVPSSPVFYIAHVATPVCFACWLVVTDALRKEKKR
jgi:hypothetical protein